MGSMVKIKLNGLNNKARSESLPADKARNAVGCIFDNDGEIIFPNPGKVSQYAGDCKWLHVGSNITLFVEGGNLKRLNDDNTATVLQSAIGSSRVFYTTVADTTYWANALSSGKIRNGVNSEWGTARPPRQPDATAVNFGGMFAGEYRIAITWLGSDGAEGGTGAGRRVSLVDGEGIHLSNFPVPPAYVTGVCIYVSSVNGKDMYLYGEFAANISDITLTKRICTIPLSTQFAFTPAPTGKIIAHMGHIFYKRDDKVYWTNIHNYGLQRKNQYWRFDSEVQVILSTPPMLYVGTKKRVYQISNIDSPDNSPAQVNLLQSCSSVPGSETSDTDGIHSYFMSDRGFIKAGAEGLQELSFDDCAIPHFGTGTMSYVEIQGLRYLIFTGQNGIANPLSNSDYSAAEALRGSL